ATAISSSSAQVCERVTNRESRVVSWEWRRAGRVLALLVVVATPRPAHASLTEAARLSAIYDAILAADFARAEAQLRESCPPAPPEACATLEVVAQWWQININPESQLADQRFTDT